MAQMGYAVVNQPVEWSYITRRRYREPFADVELDVEFAGPDGRWRVPAWWAGGSEWRVRFAPPAPGRYRFRTACSDASNADLHGREGVVEAAPYEGDNPLLARGPLRVAADRRHFEHADGTPFFWLGDTWWMGLCKRLTWPDDFQRLAADRVAKGFSVIQVVAGLYPDMPAFDPRGANEAGLPWEADYARINPAYFDAADLRIQWLVRVGLVPCVVGCWAYHLGWLGVEKMKRHWRYLIARWGAYPVVWCLAGEAAMPYYLSGSKEQDRADQVTGWAEIGRYVRQTDPYRRPVTIHPSNVARDEVADESVLDFDMIQTGHGGPESMRNTLRRVRQEYDRQPTKPVLVGEVNYEGILHGTSEEIQRLAFWSCMLSGAAGHTYGANGVWQVNTRVERFGPSPHGATWGDTPWEDACRLPGSGQLGLGRRLLERYPWWRFEPGPDWVAPAATPEDPFAAYAAGIPGQVRVVYSYRPQFPWAKDVLRVLGLEAEAQYEAFYFDPRVGREHAIGPVEADERGAWTAPVQPTMQDWVLVLERRR